MRIARPLWTPHDGASRAVALEVLINGPISRSEIARRLDLSPGSLTRLSAPLIDSGLLVETGEQADGRAGRPSRPLDVTVGSRHFVGMKLTGTELSAVVTDLRANILGSTSAPIPSRDPGGVVDLVAELMANLAESVPSITALGIGVGGRIADNSVVVSAPFLEWEGVPLVELIEARTGVPTVIENDVVSFTEAERWFGHGRGIDRFAVVTLGAGIGYGLVVHDEIVIDEDSGMGLIGHWPLDPLGPLCPAGHRGCARSILTHTAITRKVGSALGRSVTFDEVLELAGADEPAARRAVDEAGLGLGRLLAAIGNLTLPERIILGGEGVRLADVAWKAVKEGMRMDRDPRARELELMTTPGDDTEWCRGAAVIAIQTYVLGRRTETGGGVLSA